LCDWNEVFAKAFPSVSKFCTSREPSRISIISKFFRKQDSIQLFTSPFFITWNKGAINKEK